MAVIPDGLRIFESGAKMKKHVLQICLSLAVVAYCSVGVQAQTAGVQYFYDDLGRLTRVVDTSGNIATYHYDAPMNGRHL